MFNTTLPKIRPALKNIWQRLRLALGLTLAWLFALMLLGNMGQEAYTASAIAAPQPPLPVAEGSLSEKKRITESDSLEGDALSTRALSTDLCQGITQLANVSGGVSNQPSSSESGDQLIFWSTADLTQNTDFNNPDGNIEIFWGKVVPDGSQFDLEPTQVTSSTGSILGGFNLGPVISAEGDTIAFFSDRDLQVVNDRNNKDENFEIFWAELNKESGKVVKLIQVTDTSEERGSGRSSILPSISDDGRRIAFVSDNNLVESWNNEDGEGGNQEIFVAELNENATNFNITQVTSTTEQINDQPIISGDGQGIVFSRDEGEGNIELYFANVITPTDSPAPPVESRKLTNTSGRIINEQPTISNLVTPRDGTPQYYNIAFVSNRPNTRTLNIWVAKVAGNSVTVEPITNNDNVPESIDSAATSEQPSISDDGTRLAFTSDGNFANLNQDQKLQIFVYDLKTQGFSKITDENLAEQSNNQPSISGNGTQVAFISQGSLYQNRCPFTDLAVEVKAYTLSPGLEQLTKTIIAGSPLVYEMTAINNGPSKATDAKITTTVPANTAFNSAVNPGWSCDNSSTLPICELSIGDLGEDDSTYPLEKGPFYFTVTVQSNVISGTEVTNTVGILGDQLDRDQNDNKAISVLTTTRQTDLSIEVLAAPEVEPDNEIVYTLKVTNTGASDVLSATVTSSWNTTDAEFLSADQGGSEDPDSPTTAIWGPGLEIPAGDSKTLMLTLNLNTPVAAGLEDLINTVQVRDDLASEDSDTLITTVEAEPELEVTKNDNGAIPQPGETYAYTLRYFNNGTQDATDVVLTETVPINTTFNEEESHEDWVCDGNSSAAGTICTFSIGALRGDGTNAEVLFAVTVDNPVPAAADVITNTAKVDDDHENGVDPDPSNNEPSISTVLDAEPDLTITKDDGGVIPIPNSPNDTIVYTLTYTNNGDQGATGVELTEIVPDNTSFNSTLSHEDWVCTSNICTFERPSELSGGGTINTVGSSDTITFAVTVDYPLAAGITHVTNTLSIDDDGLNGDDPTNDNSDETTTTVNAAANLTITKNDNDDTEVEPGDEISYILSYSNIGNQNTTDVILSDTIPANTEFNQNANTDGWDCDGNEAGNSCELEIGILNVNTSDSVIFPVTVINPVPIGAESITNRASITDNGVNGADLDPNDNEASDINNLIAVPELELTIDDDVITSTYPSDTIVYSLNYTNAGNQEAINVVLSETIPVNTTFNEAASHPDWQGCTDNSLPGTNCTFNVGSLQGEGAIGSTGTITFALTVNNPVPSGIIEINNRAKIADNNDNNPLSSDSDESTTPLEASPELQLDKDDNESEVEPGDTITYTLTYTNAGNQDTINVTITETVPDNTEFNLAASSSGWNDCPDNSAAGTVCTYSIPSLRGGSAEIGVITFGLTVIEPVPNGEIEIINSASITDKAVNGADLVLSNNSDDDTNQLEAAPELQLTIDDGDITTAPSQNIVYMLTYTNAGNQGATGIEITETVPDETVFNAGASHPDWDCPPNASGGDTCTYDVGSLPGGSTIDSTGTVSFTVTVVESIEAGRTTISNSASIDDDGSNGADAGSNSNVEITPVTAEPILELAISDGITNVFADDLIVYTLRITNSGNQAATGIELTSTLPMNTEYQNASNSGQDNNNVVTWTIPPLPGGSTGNTIERSVTARVISNLAAGRYELENEAEVSDDGQNSNTIGQRKTASATDTNTARSAFMSITPANQIVNEEDTFNVTVQVEAGNLNINQVFAYLDFDESHLQVTALTINPSLSTDVATFDNATGQIDIETTDDQTAPFSTGTFDLVEISFEAIADSPNTSLSFNTGGARNTSVRADGVTDRFLTDETGATVTIRDFELALQASSLAVCIAQNRSTRVNLTAINGFDDPVTLASQVDPAANTTVNFSANPVTPPGSSTVTITPTAGAVLGTYDFNIVGSVAGLERSDTLSLEIQDVPGSVTLNPLNENSTTPTFSWNAASRAISYTIEIATDPGFSLIVHQQSGLTTTSYTPNPALDAGTTYFWRVRANNGCGSVDSMSSSFTTHEFALSATPSSENICRNIDTDMDYTIEVQSSPGFDDDVTLTVNEPNNSIAVFDTNPVTSADYTSILTISNIAQVQVGSHTINIDGTADSDGLERSTSVDLNVEDVPSQVNLTSPTYNQSNVPTDTITFEWNTDAIAGATSYNIRISDDRDFPLGQTDSFTVTSTTYTYTPTTSLDTNTRYYWQVRANNDCGNGQYSTRFQFRTANTNAIVSIDRDDSSSIRQLTRDAKPEEVLPIRSLQKGAIHKERLILLSKQVSRDMGKEITLLAQ